MAWPLVAMAVGYGLQAWGQHRQGQAAGDAADSQAEALQFNARVAHLQAQDAVQRGKDEESRFRVSVRGLIGSQRAGFAGQNVDVGTGSARDVQGDAAYLGELDALQIRANAEREAWGYRVEAEDLRSQAQIARRGGQALRTAGTIGAITTAVGGAAQIGMLAQRYGWSSSPSSGAA